MTAPFAPARWLPGPNAQTVFANLWRPPSGLRPRRERWELPDGDFLDVDRHGDPDGPTAVVLHGLEGSSRAPYVVRMVSALQARGLSAVALNFRGCSGTMNRLPRLYHSGETGDLDLAVRRLAAERPGRPLAVTGFSLGGNVTAKWLGERGAGLPGEVRAGAVISVPFDLSACARTIDGPGFWPFVYRERFLRMLRAKALAKARAFPALLDAAAIPGIHTFADFDEQVTARLHGFTGARDYWARSSSGPFLSGVRVPLLLLSADDDPMVPAASLPRPGRSPHLTVEVTRGGGHVGFVSGAPWGFHFHAERRAADFVAAALAS
ncbi:MAG: alpha/beta fold hydrolase [Deltaproteobacteria bacterium]|nr:alpha/beta fold hydrolase [Deltaproteobacteria bacterium]